MFSSAGGARGACAMGDLSVDTEPLVGLASDKLLTCVQKINDTAAETIQKGLEELTSLTKRSDDVSDCLDVLLSGKTWQASQWECSEPSNAVACLHSRQAHLQTALLSLIFAVCPLPQRAGGLLPKVLSFLRPEILTEFEGEVSVRGIAVVPVTVPLGEAIQLAACTALGESSAILIQCWRYTGIPASAVCKHASAPNNQRPVISGTLRPYRTAPDDACSVAAV